MLAHGHGRKLGDFLHDVHALDDLAEHGIAPAVLRGIVEKAVAAEVDEELRGCRVRRAGARHGDRAGFIPEAVAGFVFDWRAGRLFPEVHVETAALDHETVDDAVENRIAVVACLNVVQEVGDRPGGEFGTEFKYDVALVGLEFHIRAGGLRRKRAEAEGQGSNKVSDHACSGNFQELRKADAAGAKGSTAIL